MAGALKISLGLVGILIFESCSNEDSPVIKAKTDSLPAAQPAADANQNQKAIDNPPTVETKTQAPLPEKLAAHLAWDKDANTVLSYRVYYTGANQVNTAGTLMMTLNAEPGKDIANNVNVGSFSLGSKACFYIVAANHNVVSPPSESVCQTF